jgi:hypothetical protein
LLCQAIHAPHFICVLMFLICLLCQAIHAHHFICVLVFLIWAESLYSDDQQNK